MEEKIQTLESKDAVALWRKGSAAWNGWVETNPKYNVNFNHVDFRQLTGNTGVSFCDPPVN